MNKLVTIAISHYCEKARWALELADIPYTESKHIPGFHALFTRRYSNDDMTPVLSTPHGVIEDSTEILKWVDKQIPENKKLYPSHIKKEIEDFETFLDEGLGVAGRLWMYSYMLDHLPVILKYSKKHGVPWFETLLMPLAFKTSRKGIRAFIRLKPESRQKAKAEIDHVFDKVAEMLRDGRSFLFGEQFTAADLTFASLAAAVTLPENYGVLLPSLEDLPVEMSKQVQEWREHPAGQYALRLFRTHRTKNHLL